MIGTEVTNMETKDILLDLRTKKGLSQDELAEKVFVTRQAVSRWENGETTPNTETLKLLSAFYGVSINTLLGSPRKLICQCCGMPLDDAILSRDEDGALNENYCQWCYADGQYTYSDMDDLINVSVPHMVGAHFTAEQARSYLKATLPTLDYWKHFDKHGGGKALEELKTQLIAELNALQIKGMPNVEKLNALVGSYVNLAYPLPSGNAVPFLKDDATYLGNQLESTLGDGRCFGVLGNREFLLVAGYGENGADPQLLIFKKRS